MHMFEVDWTTSSKPINHCAFNSQYDWGNLGIHLKNWHTCTLNSKQQINESQILNLIFCQWFIIILLVQHEFSFINVIS